MPDSNQAATTTNSGKSFFKRKTTSDRMRMLLSLSLLLLKIYLSFQRKKWRIILPRKTRSTDNANFWIRPLRQENLLAWPARVKLLLSPVSSIQSLLVANVSQPARHAWPNNLTGSHRLIRKE